MMRRLLYGCLALLLLAACGKEVEGVQQWDGPVMELRLACVNPSDPTKAGSDGTESGSDAYNENLISWVDFYFYPDGETTKNASYHIHQVSGKVNNDVFLLNLTTNQVNNRIFPVLTNTTETLVFAIANAPEGLLDGLSDTSLDNLNQLVVPTNFVDVPLTNHSQTRFMMSGSTILTLSGRSQKMVSQGMIGLARYASKITVGIKMDDEVRVDTGRKDELEHKIEEIWTPRPQQMQIYLVDGVNEVNLSGIPAGMTGGATPSYFSYRSNPMRFYDPDTGQPYFNKTGDYYNTFPSYTYPCHWDNGDEHEPYLKLVLPWDRAEDTANNITSMQKEFYYKILIPQDRRGGEFLNSFVRNNWYHYDIEVGVLGADTDEAAVEMEATLFIVYWQDKDVVVKHANIGNARYLSLNETQYNLHNVSTVDAGYVTSHPINYNIASVTRPYYGTKTSGTDLGADILCADGTHTLCGTGISVVMDTDLYEEGSYYLSYSEQQRKDLTDSGEDWFSDTGGAIRLTHEINNDYSSPMFDYSPYTMFVEIWHQDGIQSPEFVRTVTITQYPGVYIKSEKNSDPKYSTAGGDDEKENNQNAWKNFEHNGYVFIDGERRSRHNVVGGVDVGCQYDVLMSELGSKGYTTGESGTARAYIEWLQWRTVNFTGGNRNMYNISVTVLPESSGFVIGDPRTLEPDNFNNGYETGYKGGDDLEAPITFAEGTPIGGGDPRPLTNYYPAENSSRTKDMIAPAIRIASKFGGMEYGKASKKAAEFKCATYQEDGYPAGRWRLPTLAEIGFIATLQAQKTFVVLFGNTTYWSVNGAVQVDAERGKATEQPKVTQALARCVYDSWYWDQLPAPYNRLPEGDRDHYVLGDLPR